MIERARAEWRADFDRLAGRTGLIAPKLCFLPDWWPASTVAFAYFHVVAIGPGLLRAPAEVRHYVLGHELGHIERRHTLGQVAYWLSVLAAAALGRLLPAGFEQAPILGVLLAALSWLTLGETRRELEADDAAAARFGDLAVIHGLSWLLARRRGRVSKLSALRLARRRARLAASTT